MASRRTSPLWPADECRGVCCGGLSWLLIARPEGRQPRLLKTANRAPAHLPWLTSPVCLFCLSRPMGCGYSRHIAGHREEAGSRRGCPAEYHIPAGERRTLCRLMSCMQQGRGMGRGERRFRGPAAVLSGTVLRRHAVGSRVPRGTELGTGTASLPPGHGLKRTAATLQAFRRSQRAMQVGEISPRAASLGHAYITSAPLLNPTRRRRRIVAAWALTYTTVSTTPTNLL